MNTKNVIIIIFALVFGFASSFLLPETKSREEKTYSEGWKDAMTRVQNSGYLEKVANFENIRNISGRVEKIEDGVIKIQLSFINPLGDPSLDIREIEVGGHTSLYKVVKNNTEDYQDRLDEIRENKSRISAISSEEVPALYLQSEISFSDLTVGDLIQIENEKIIGNQHRFVADKITVLNQD